MLVGEGMLVPKDAVPGVKTGRKARYAHLARGAGSNQDASVLQKSSAWLLKAPAVRWLQEVASRAVVPLLGENNVRHPLLLPASLQLHHETAEHYGARRGLRAV